jgi:hypothetical protein
MLLLHIPLYWHLPEDGHLTLKRVRVFKFMYNLVLLRVYLFQITGSHRSLDQGKCRPILRHTIRILLNQEFYAKISISTHITSTLIRYDPVLSEPTGAMSLRE